MTYVKQGPFVDRALPALTGARASAMDQGIADAHAAPAMRRQVFDHSAGVASRSVPVAQSDAGWRITLLGRVNPASGTRYPNVKLNGAGPNWSRSMMTYAWSNGGAPTGAGPVRVGDNAGFVFGELGYGLTDGDLIAEMVLSGRPNNEGFQYAAHSRWTWRGPSGAENYEGGQVVSAVEYATAQGFPKDITSLLVDFAGATHYGHLIVEPLV